MKINFKTIILIHDENFEETDENFEETFMIFMNA